MRFSQATTLGILIICLVMVSVIALTADHFGIENTYSAAIGNSDNLTAPVSYVDTFNASTFWGLLSGNLVGAPIFITYLTWFFLALGVICLVFLIRGVS